MANITQAPKEEHLDVARKTLELQRKSLQEQQRIRQLLEEVRDNQAAQKMSKTTLGVVGP